MEIRKTGPLKIGYQGIDGSFAQIAAVEAAKGITKMGDSKLEYIPLETSKNVLKQLANRNIDVGIVAIENSSSGEVKETAKALKELENHSVTIIDVFSIPIHQCLFKKNENSNIEYIASHIQALHQTRKYLKKIYPDYLEIELTDTALAAKKLSNGELNDNVGVICSKNAGELYNLTFVTDKICDENNETTFVMLKML